MTADPRRRHLVRGAAAVLTLWTVAAVADEPTVDELYNTGQIGEALRRCNAIWSGDGAIPPDALACAPVFLEETGISSLREGCSRGGAFGRRTCEVLGPKIESLAACRSGACDAERAALEEAVTIAFLRRRPAISDAIGDAKSFLDITQPVAQIQRDAAMRTLRLLVAAEEKRFAESGHYIACANDSCSRMLPGFAPDDGIDVEVSLTPSGFTAEARYGGSSAEAVRYDSRTRTYR